MAIYLFVDKSKNEFSLAPAVARIDNLGNVAALHKVFEYGKLLLLAAGNNKLPESLLIEARAKKISNS